MLTLPKPIETIVRDDEARTAINTLIAGNEETVEITLEAENDRKVVLRAVSSKKVSVAVESGRPIR